MTPRSYSRRILMVLTSKTTSRIRMTPKKVMKSRSIAFTPSCTPSSGIFDRPNLEHQAIHGFDLDHLTGFDRVFRHRAPGLAEQIHPAGATGKVSDGFGPLPSQSLTARHLGAAQRLGGEID